MLPGNASKAVLRLANVGTSASNCFRGGDSCDTPIRVGDLVLSETTIVEGVGSIRKYSHLHTCIPKALHWALPGRSTALATLHPLDFEWYGSHVGRDKSIIPSEAFWAEDKAERTVRLRDMDIAVVFQKQNDYDTRVLEAAQARWAQEKAVKDARDAASNTPGRAAPRMLITKGAQLLREKMGPKILADHPVVGLGQVAEDLTKLRSARAAEEAAKVAKDAAAKAAKEAARVVEETGMVLSAKGAEERGADAGEAGAARANEQENKGAGLDDAVAKGQDKGKKKAKASVVDSPASPPPPPPPPPPPLVGGSGHGRVTRSAKRPATPGSSVAVLEVTSKESGNKRGRTSGGAGGDKSGQPGKASSGAASGKSGQAKKKSGGRR